MISAGLRPHLVTRLKAFHFSSLLAARLAPHPLTTCTHTMTSAQFSTHTHTHTPFHISTQFEGTLGKDFWITCKLSYQSKSQHQAPSVPPPFILSTTPSSYTHKKFCYCTTSTNWMSQYRKVPEL